MGQTPTRTEGTLGLRQKEAKDSEQSQEKAKNEQYLEY